MPHINFADILWKKQEKYIEERKNYIDRFNAFCNIFNYFQPGQTVAQIACGSILGDLFFTMERVEREGRIILIDENPAFVYNRASKILDGKNLPRERAFYTRTKEGKELLKDFFSQANIKIYVQRLPPYPQQINDESIDHIMAINAAFELMATPIGGTPANIEGLISETYKKLRNGGSLIVQGLMGSDIDLFRMHIYNTIKRNGLSLEEDLEVLESLDGPLSPLSCVGYWGRWVKK